jgi:uncharacterized membrane protein
MPVIAHQALLLLHLLGVITWVGGMFFAYFCLRPAAAGTLQLPQRLPLWSATLERFLRYTAVAVLLVLFSGLAMFSRFGFNAAPVGWHFMFALGLLMAVLFSYVYFVLHPRLRAHCSSSAWPAAAQALNAIRRLVAVNLALGLCIVVAAVSAR